jgi:hypothetical protein
MNPAQVLQWPLVNGAHTSFCSIELKLGGSLPINAIKSILYSDPLTDTTVYGTSPKPAGSTRGQLKPAGTIEFYRKMFDAILEILTIGGKIGYAEKRWPVTVSYAELGAIDIKQDLLSNVKFHSPDFSSSEGTDALTVKMIISPLEILWHGTGAPKRALTSAFARIG